MKLIALLALPWMAACSLAIPSGPTPVAVRYAPAGTLAEKGWRIGDECYVKPGFLSLLGWRCSIIDGGVEVTVGSNHAKVAFLPGVVERLVPLRATLTEIGATSRWTNDFESLDICSVIRTIEVTNLRVKIATSLPVKPVFKQAIHPDRIFVDIPSSDLSPQAAKGLPSTVKATVMNSGRVRLSIQTTKQPASVPVDPTDSIVLDLVDQGVALSPADINETETPTNPIKTTTSETKVGPMKMVSDEHNVTTLELPILGKLGSAPRFRRVTPSLIELTMPGAKYTDPPEWPHYSGVKSVESRAGGVDAVLTLTLERPMGIVLSSDASHIVLMMYRPNVGDGRLAGKTVVVDPGHGGTDTGAQSIDNRTNEKDVTLTIGKLLAEHLSREGATVIMTRKTDVLIPLKERSEIANRNHADFFVSVHINSNRLANSRSGNITFYHASDPISSLLADCIQRQIAKVSGLPSLGVWSDNRIYSSGFAVLRYAKMPAVLLELGFINHSVDLKRIQESDFREKISEAVIKGIRTYLGNAETNKLIEDPNR